MRVVAISDTHGYRPEIPDGDLLIHSGDLCNKGMIAECVGELEWLNSQPHKRVILVPGNHDFAFQTHLWALGSSLGKVECLIDSGTKVDGLVVWGYPWVPILKKWAFYGDRNKLRTHLKMIPGNVDLLVTHGPPWGTLDTVRGGVRAGCEDLTSELERIRPVCHIFGHIHEGYGERYANGTQYINAATCDRRYDPVNAPVVFDITANGVAWPNQQLPS